MADQPTSLRIDFPRVRLFRADGPAHVYDRGKVTARTFSEADLDQAVRNFGLLCCGEQPLFRPPLGPGHPQNTDPAWGTVADVWREGNEFWGSLANVSPEVAADMEAGRWLDPSVEFYDSPEQAEIPEHLRRGASGLLLRRVGLMGAIPPRVKGLGSPAWAAGEVACGQWNPLDHEPRYTCSEGARTMNDDQMTVAKAAGFGDSFLGTLDDDQMNALITDLAGRALGVQPGNESPAEPAPVAGAGEGDMSRDQMISELVSMGEDETTLQQMDDASLKELYASKKGGGAPAPAAPTMMGEVATVGHRASPSTRGLSLHTVRQYAQATARAEVTKQRVVERTKAVNDFVDRMSGKKITPAQAGTAEKPGPVRQQLHRASAVHKFGEAESELELQMRTIEGGPDVRHFGELIADPHQQSEYADVEARTKDFAQRKNKRFQQN